MNDIFQKLHGTTVDRFGIGNNNQTIILTGTTTSVNGVQLLDRDAQSFSVDSAVFFSAHIAGTGTNVAAYEIKGCYLLSNDSMNGYTVTTYTNTADVQDPVITFNNGEITVTAHGATGDTINWTAVINLVLV